MYSLTNAEKSILIATPVLLGSLMRIPMGILTDRFGGRKVYSLTMLALLLPTICAGFTHSYSMLLFWAFLSAWLEQHLLFPLHMSLNGIHLKSKVLF